MQRLLRRTLVVDAKAVRYSRNGNPSTVLKMETVKLDTSSMPSTSVLVRMLAAPIAPVDLAQVAGSASFPSSGGRVCGNEGVGVVEEAGSGSGLVKGSIVVPNTGGLGTWATHVISPGAAWTAVPDSVAKGAIEPVAAGVAPYLAAKHLLEGFVKLGKGDVVVLNNGGSLVSQALVQLAKAKGVTTVTLVAPGSGPAWKDISPHLTAVGASLVVGEGEAATHEFKKTLADFKGAVLGLNSSGGAAALTVARSLAPGGTLVTYGTATRRTPSITAPLDIFTALNLTLKGFNLETALKGLDKGARNGEVAGAASSVAAGEVKLLVAREPFADFNAALKRATTPGVERPVVLVF